MKFDLTNDKLYDTLIKIKERPKMWLSDKTLSALKDFLNGYFIHDYFTGVDGPLWYDYFGRYVSEDCPGSEFCGNIFSNLINNGYSGEEGFDFFFELLSKFSNDFVTLQEVEVSQPTPMAYAVKLSFSAVASLATEHVLSQTRDLFNEDEKLIVFAEWSKDKETVTMVVGNETILPVNILNILDRRELKSLPLVEIPLTHLKQYMFTEIPLDK